MYANDQHMGFASEDVKRYARHCSILKPKQPISFPISSSTLQRETTQDSMHRLQEMLKDLQDQHLQQRHFLFGKRELTLRGVQELHIRESSLLRDDELSIPLWQLRAGAAFTRNFSLQWCLASIFMLLMTAGLAFALIHTDSMAWSYALLLIPGFAIFYSTYQFMEYSYDLVVYKQSGSNNNLLFLWNKRPSEERLKYFLHCLDERIQLAQTILVDDALTEECGEKTLRR